MPVTLWPENIRISYEVHEWRHATAILHTDFRDQFDEICQVLTGFKLCKSYIEKGGGNKSPVAGSLDQAFYNLGWEARKFATQIVIDGDAIESPTHMVDCFKNRIALEIEWNNKDPFYDRDLNNFRLLFDLRVAAVGVIVTRCDSLQNIFKQLGRQDSFGQSTTHMSKLLPKIEGGGAAGCPVVVFGIKEILHDENC